MEGNLEKIVGNEEKILWKGKPSKKCFILESIFNPLLPFALMWLLFDIFAMGKSMSLGGDKAGGFILVFMLFHLMPVWIYLGGVLLSFRRYKNTEYVITDRGIYVSGGVFSYTYEMKPFTELSHVRIHRGIFDQSLGVGDVEASSNQTFNYTNRSNSSAVTAGISIKDIPDYMEVFNMVKKLQTDIYSDTMYPNDLRPKENHGYKTEYKG
ncbi:MAG: PH domain-containing protein [Clostridia bacterium]|nr:PH domain-containing protein [Clostridia bacterium]